VPALSRAKPKLVLVAANCQPIEHMERRNIPPTLATHLGQRRGGEKARNEGKE